MPLLTFLVRAYEQWKDRGRRPPLCAEFSARDTSELVGRGLIFANKHLRKQAISGHLRGPFILIIQLKLQDFLCYSHSTPDYTIGFRLLRPTIWA
jgi:hypothetical protein